jgi:hypothetical protein
MVAIPFYGTKVQGKVSQLLLPLFYHDWIRSFVTMMAVKGTGHDFELTDSGGSTSAHVSSFCFFFMPTLNRFCSCVFRFALYFPFRDILKPEMLRDERLIIISD